MKERTLAKLRNRLDELEADIGSGSGGGGSSQSSGREESSGDQRERRKSIDKLVKVLGKEAQGAAEVTTGAAAGTAHQSMVQNGLDQAAATKRPSSFPLRMRRPSAGSGDVPPKRQPSAGSDSGPAHPPKQQLVTLRKPTSEAPLGISLTSTGPDQPPAIEALTPGLPGAESLRAGQTLLAVNGAAIAGAAQGMEALAASDAGEVQLLVCEPARRPSQSSLRKLALRAGSFRRSAPGLQHITLHKGDQSTRLGLQLSNDERDELEVSGLAPGSPAASAGLVVGQKLVAINGAEVYGHEQATALLLPASGDVVLTVRKARSRRAASQTTTADPSASTSQLVTSAEITSRLALDFDRLLQSKAGVQALLDFAALEFADENVQYWTESQQYKQLAQGRIACAHLGAARSEQLHRAGADIIRAYLCDGATLPLNVSAGAAKPFKQKPGDRLVEGDEVVADGVYTYGENLFQQVDKDVYQNMKDIFQRFRLSDKVDGLLQAEPMLALDEPSQAFGAELRAKLSALLRDVERACPCERLSAWGVEGSTMHLLAGSGLANADIRLPVGEGLVGAAVASGEHLLVTDAYAHPSFNPEVDEATGFATSGVLCVVFARDGQPRGALQLMNKAAPQGSTSAEAPVFCDEDATALCRAFQERFIDLCNKAAESARHEDIGVGPSATDRGAGSSSAPSSPRPNGGATWVRSPSLSSMLGGLRRRASSPSKEKAERQVTVHKDGFERVGLQFFAESASEPPTIVGVLPGHPAALAGLEVGHTVSAINGTPVLGHDHASALMLEATGDVVLTVRPPSRQDTELLDAARYYPDLEPPAVLEPPGTPPTPLPDAPLRQSQHEADQIADKSLARLAASLAPGQPAEEETDDAARITGEAQQAAGEWRTPEQVADEWRDAAEGAVPTEAGALQLELEREGAHKPKKLDYFLESGDHYFDDDDISSVQDHSEDYPEEDHVDHGLGV